MQDLGLSLALAGSSEETDHILCDWSKSPSRGMAARDAPRHWVDRAPYGLAMSRLPLPGISEGKSLLLVCHIEDADRARRVGGGV
jgi:hypothetical protein